MMKTIGEMLTRHRNTFLLGVLITTLVISGYANQERVKAASATVDIPVTEVSAQPLSALESYRQTRDQEALADIAALEKLIAQPGIDAATREDAADRLQEIINARQAQSALEGTLVGSSLYPCAAVVAGGSVTIVTEKSTVTDKDSTLVMTLAAAHTGVSPENVRIITAE